MGKNASASLLPAQLFSERSIRAAEQRRLRLDKEHPLPLQPTASSSVPRAKSGGADEATAGVAVAGTARPAAPNDKGATRSTEATARPRSTEATARPAAANDKGPAISGEATAGMVPARAVEIRSKQHHVDGLARSDYFAMMRSALDKLEHNAADDVETVAAAFAVINQATTGLMNLTAKKASASSVLDDSMLQAVATRGPAIVHSGYPTASLLFDERYIHLHELFDCEADRSAKINLKQYLDELGALVILEVIPAGFGQVARITAPEVKCLIKDIYTLIISLHETGFALGGSFCFENFVILKTRKRLTVKFTNNLKSSLQNADPHNKEKDLLKFVEMVRRSLFERQFPPHDITHWLSLVGVEELKDIMPEHSLLMNIEACSQCFMNLYDKFVDMKEKNSVKYNQVCQGLNSYNGWRSRLSEDKGNRLLYETLGFGSYGNSVDELLRLLRNSRQHSSRYRHALFSVIVGQDFPNLIADFQNEMFKACLV